MSVPLASRGRGDAAVFFAVLAWCAVAGALHAAAPFVGSGSLWGADAYAFLPPAWGVAAVCAALATAVLAWRHARSDAGTSPHDGGALVPAWTVRLAGTAAAMALFWIAREGHTLLGDGTPLTRNLAHGERFHPHEPLALVLHHVLWTWVRGLPGQGAREGAQVARDAVALGSVLAGGMFVWLAPSLGAALARWSGTPTRRVAMLATLVVCTQGYLQLCFGYAENYTYAFVALAAALLAALEAIERRTSLAPAGALIVLAVAFDLSAVLFVPAWCVAAALASREPARRGAIVLDVLLVLGTALVAQFALGRIGDGYRFDRALAEVIAMALRGHGEGGRLAYLFSAQHATDFLNEHVLAGPFGAFALLVALALAIRSRRLGGDAGVFVLAAALPALGAAWVTGDLNLGYPRDWDLFTPFALVFTVAALALLLAQPSSARMREAWLVVALAASLLHTAPWVAVNASFDRSFARFQTLPLGFGRTETVVGQWYLEHGDRDRAKLWLRRAVTVNPANNAAHYHLGLIAMDDADVGTAIAHFARASALRPDKENYRLRLVDALALAGEPERARAALRPMRERGPGDLRWAACEVVLLVGTGDRAAAERLATSAASSAPASDTLVRALEGAVREGLPYAELLRRFWNALVWEPAAPAGAAAPENGGPGR